MFRRDRLNAQTALFNDFLKKAGFTNNFIINNSANYRFHDPLFYAAMRHLVRKEKLSVTDALSQLRDLQSLEIQILKDLYHNGLRGEHFRCYHRANVYVGIDVFAIYQIKTVAEYFQKLFCMAVKQGIEPLAAFRTTVNEMAAITKLKLTEFPDADKGMRFLIRHIKDGIRARDAKGYFTSRNARNMVAYLRIVFNMDLKHALAQISGLTDEQILFLKNYFYAGVRKQHIQHYPHPIPEVEMMIYRLGLESDPLKALIVLTKLDTAAYCALRDTPQRETPGSGLKI